MIKYFILVLFGASICLTAYAYPWNVNITEPDTSVCRLHVLKISTVKNAYIIYAFNEADSSQFAIVSLKCKSRIGEKIKAGNKYEMRLIPYFDKETFPDHMLVFEVNVSGIKIIVPSEGWASNVFISPDLLGLNITR